MPGRVSRKDIDGFVKVCKVVIMDYGAKTLANNIWKQLPVEHDIKDSIKDKILDEVGQLYGIKPSSITKSNKSKSLPANIMVTILFNNYLSITQREISGMMGIAVATVNMRIKQFARAQSNKVNITEGYGKIFDEEFMSNYNKINVIIRGHVGALQKKK
jgi:hypothetical protein